jgi:hypothetical protein
MMILCKKDSNDFTKGKSYSVTSNINAGMISIKNGDKK